MLRDKILCGLPLDVTVIDVHAHFGAYGMFFVPRHSYEDFVKICDTLGVDKAMVSAHMSVGSDCKKGNDQTIDFVQKYSGKVYGYATINPNDIVDPLQELNRCFAHDGFVGIKTLPKIHNRRFMDKAYIPTYEFASQKKCAYLFHVWGEDEILEFVEVAKEYPDFPKIMGHSGATYEGFNKAVEIANTYKNVYLDTALSLAPQGNVEWLVGQVGSKKVVYGSDFQYFDPRITIGRIAMAEISEEEKADVLGKNAENIFNGLI